MCGGHHHRTRPSRLPEPEQWVERLQSYREHLEGELKNVQELLERLDRRRTTRRSRRSRRSSRARLPVGRAVRDAGR